MNVLREKEGLGGEEGDDVPPIVWIDSGTFVDLEHVDSFQAMAKQARLDGGFFAARSGIQFVFTLESD